MRAFFIKIALLLGIISQPIETPPEPPKPVFVAEIIENSTPIAISTIEVVELGGEVTTTQEAYNWNCTCVAYASQRSIYKNFPKVEYAAQIIPLKQVPKVGAVIIFNPVGRYGPKLGHAGVVEEIISTTTIRISEKNLTPCEITERII